MRRWRARLTAVWHSDPRAIEALLTLAAASWAVTLLRQGETFDTGTAFDAMQQIAPEEVWALAAAALALFAPLALVFRLYRLRQWAIACHAAFWAFVSVMIFQANPLTDGWGIYGLFALFALWAAWRLGPRPGPRW